MTISANKTLRTIEGRHYSKPHIIFAFYRIQLETTFIILIFIYCYFSQQFVFMHFA
jgi:hypothetical protein